MINETSFDTVTVGEIVTADFRAAEIFKKAGIDFCCGGKKSLAKACEEKKLDPRNIAEKLELLESEGGPKFNFDNWNLDFLCDYIVNTHHKYVMKTLPELVFYTEKIARVHGSNHPELLEVESLFSQINDELTTHLRKEEEILFPAIRNVVSGKTSGYRNIIQTEITKMLGEHDFAGGAMDKINTITEGYSLPDDACNTYRVTLRLLNQFEDDLHNHVHLENNILFPKAMKL